MKDTLINAAMKARKNAYAPYSHFKVGAALMTDSNEVYTGCNIENSSYPLTCCAERVAIFKAVSEGHTSFQAMAIIGDSEQAISPCGACRQVMAQFLQQDVPIYLTNLTGHLEITNIEDLLPGAFQL
ncbi:MAG TPA: cytidine deaminase [Pseudogracilibacillus sp.]|nr:cytidine deaminase [Pseudogracilibacillus sp.]